MADHAELLSLLAGISTGAELDRSLVTELQDRIWDTKPLTGPDTVLEILADLAYDLDFWEPDPAKRREDPSFFGDDRARAEIREAVERLREYGAHFPPQVDA